MSEEGMNGAGTETAPAATDTKPATEGAAETKTFLEGAQAGEGEGAANNQSQQAEGQSGEPADKADGEKSEEGKEPEGAPESYEDFKAPEGIELNSGVMDEFKGLAKELNLPQEKAQSVIDRMLPAMQRRQAEYLAEINVEWSNRCLNDKEVGGSNLPATQTAVARLRDKFAFNEDGTMDADIQEFLQSPFGNHPGAVKLLARAGKAFGEAGFPTGKPAGSGKPTAADFYASAKRR